MAKKTRRVLSLDDLWSVLGFILMTAVNLLTRPPMDFAQISLLASGMIAIVWLASANLRQRNRYPNYRVALWAMVAVASAIVAAQ